ncbi:hypothetical protein ACLMNJ_29015 [Streptomyces seoulensis]
MSVRDLTEVQLDRQQCALLAMIGSQQAKDPDGQWPMWDWVEHHAKLFGQENPQGVLESLPRVGAPPGDFGLSYGFTTAVPRILERDTRIALTVAGAWALNEVRYDLGEPFLRVLHHMIALWRSAPRSPNEVTQVTLTSEDLQLALPQMPSRIVRLIPDHFGKEPFLHSSWSKQQDGRWQMDIPRAAMWFQHATDLRGYVSEACWRVNDILEADRVFLTGQPVPTPPLDPVAHVGASRTALLTWLWRQTYNQESAVPMSDVLGVLSSDGLCEDQGVRFTEEEIDRASEYLETAGLIVGGGAIDQKAGPVLARITAAGEDCVENYRADVGTYLRERRSGTVTFHINNNNGNIATNSSGFTQNAVTQTAIDPTQLLEAIKLIQQLTPALTPDTEEQQELRAQVDELQAATAAPIPDRGALRRIADGVMSTIRGLAHSPDVQRLAIEAVEQGIHSL